MAQTPVQSLESTTEQEFKRRVLINDDLGSDVAEKLFQEQGYQVDTGHFSENELVGMIDRYDALIVRSSTTVTKKILEAGAKDRLVIVGRAGNGTDNVDLETASANGIIVKNSPYGNTVSTAELTLGFMIDLARGVTSASASLREGTWYKQRYLGRQLKGSTLGIIGCGRIGSYVAKLAKRHGMNVIGYDLKPIPDTGIDYKSLDEVLHESDFVSIHVDKAIEILGERELFIMKPTAYLINAARAPHINETALYNALKEGQIAGYAGDVHTHEPKEEGAEFESPLREFDNVILTPHLGAMTEQARPLTAEEIARVTIDFLEKGDYTNAVNVAERATDEPRQLYPVRVLHQDVPGAFEQISGIFARHDINIRQPKSRETIGDGGMVHTTYLVHDMPPAQVISELRELDLVQRVMP